MASYINRSPFAVTVTNRPDLYDEFPHSGEPRALEYAAALKATGNESYRFHHSSATAKSRIKAREQSRRKAAGKDEPF